MDPNTEAAGLKDFLETLPKTALENLIMASNLPKQFPIPPTLQLKNKEQTLKKWHSSSDIHDILNQHQKKIKSKASLIYKKMSMESLNSTTEEEEEIEDELDNVFLDLLPTCDSSMDFYLPLLFVLPESERESAALKYNQHAKPVQLVQSNIEAQSAAPQTFSFDSS